MKIHFLSVRSTAHPRLRPRLMADFRLLDVATSRRL